MKSLEQLHKAGKVRVTKEDKSYEIVFHDEEGQPFCHVTRYDVTRYNYKDPVVKIIHRELKSLSETPEFHKLENGAVRSMSKDELNPWIEWYKSKARADGKNLAGAGGAILAIPFNWHTKCIGQNGTRKRELTKGELRMALDVSIEELDILILAKK